MELEFRAVGAQAEVVHLQPTSHPYSGSRPVLFYGRRHREQHRPERPNIIAAHGDLVLIYGVVAVKGVRVSSYPGNFFLYKASPRLPPPSPGNCWRGRAEFTGVLHEGGDDFIMANLHALVGAQGEEMTKLFRYSYGSGEWDFFRIDMPGDAASGFYPQRPKLVYRYCLLT